MAEDPGDQYSVSSDELQISLDDVMPCRETPDGLSFQGTPAPDYHGPLSTPALFLGNAGQSLAVHNRYTQTQSCDTATKTRSHQQYQINYPYYMDMRNNATTSNMEYYHVRPKPNDFSPSWLTHLTSQPFEELHRAYKRKGYNNAQNIPSKQTSKHPTPGERALTEGWKRNTIDRNSELDVSSNITENSDHAITHAFPPSRLLLSRAKTTASEPLNRQSNQDGSINLNKSRWLNFASCHITPNLWNQESASSSYKRFPKDFSADHRSFQKRSKNYLSFMTNSRRSGASKRWSNGDHRNVDLPNIKVTSTVLAALKHSGRSTFPSLNMCDASENPRGDHFYGYNFPTTSHYSDHIKPVNGTVTNPDDQLIRKRCVLCIPPVSSET